MQLSNAPAKLTLPFANSGAKNTIPAPSQVGITPGAASLTDGFPPLTRTLIAAGGVPPSGLDMNGILFELSAIARWAASGGGFTYDGTFAADVNVGGYPKGARVLRTDALGYWLNTTDNNTTDPEAGGAGWVPDFTSGSAPVTMTNANVTLTPLQYGLPMIVITGALTANLNLIFPALIGKWIVVNNTTGAFNITAKTAAGTGVALSAGENNVFGNGINIDYFGLALPQTDARYQAILMRTSNVTPLPAPGGLISVSHTLGVIPKHVTLECVCLAADRGYSIGDVVQITEMYNSTGPVIGSMTILKSTTSVDIQLASGFSLSIRDKTTGLGGVPTAASWAYRLVLG